MAEGRLKSYKNKEVPDALGLRQRREEEGIQIRKSKREDEVSSPYLLVLLEPYCTYSQALEATKNTAANS
eukprot:m.245349 g.245349  ORF g.245349 m.245349 type:complete len:70 (+) comp40254_c3_seq87:30-239(+)